MAGERESWALPGGPGGGPAIDVLLQVIPECAKWNQQKIEEINCSSCHDDD